MGSNYLHGNFANCFHYPLRQFPPHALPLPRYPERHGDATIRAQLRS